MPAYNHEKFVGPAIESVLNQSMSELELVIVNDGSTDSTEAVIQSFDDPRIHYHYQHNQDAYNALNAGIGFSRGEFIAIINSDDVYTPNRLQRLVEVQRESSAEFLFSDVEPIDENGRQLGGTPHPWNDWHRRNRDFYAERNNLFRGFLHGNFMVTTSNIFMSASLCERVGGFAPIRYLHDYDYVFRLLEAAGERAGYLQHEKLLMYRIHGGNTLSEAAITGREQDREIIRKYLLRALPETSRELAETGINRLIELEHELIQVRRQLRQQSKPKPPTPVSLPRRILRAARRRLSGAG